MTKQWQNIFNVIANANSIVQHIIQITNGIMKHANASIKLIASAKSSESYHMYLWE